MKQFIIFLFTVVITINLFAQTNNEDYYINMVLEESINEIDKQFGQQIDEYTILAGAGYNENNGVKQFTYFYVVSPEVWEDLLMATDDMKQLNFDSFKTLCKINNGVNLFISILIDNNIELVLSYLCKNQYVDIVYSINELKQFRE